MTPEDRITLVARLKSAEAAYHTLMTGGATRVIVDQNGERVEFNPTTSGRLSAYIQLLKNQLGMGCGGAPSGPLQVWL